MFIVLQYKTWEISLGKNLAAIIEISLGGNLAAIINWLIHWLYKIDLHWLNWNYSWN